MATKTTIATTWSICGRAMQHFSSKTALTTLHVIGAYFICHVVTHIAYHDDILYIANPSTIYLIQCKEKYLYGEKKCIDIENNQIHKVVIGLPIHALFINKVTMGPAFIRKNMVTVAIETPDS